MSNSYWDRTLGRRLTRRRALAATGASAAAAAFLAACGGGDDDDDGEGGGDSGGATSGTTETPKVGGNFIWQGYGDPGGGLELIKIRNAGVNQLASLTHDPLLYFAYGRPGYPGIGTEVLPMLATALPEISPDKLRFTFKLHPNAKFSDGKALTSEDVKWTFDTLGTAQESAWRTATEFNWIEATEAPDPTTFVVKANKINADALQSLALKNQAGILHRQHHESGAAEKSLLGSGPYQFVEYQPPLITKYKRNPNYWAADRAGYFETIDRLGTSDQEKKVADIIAKQTHLTYWFDTEVRERIKSQRKDLQIWQYPGPDARQIYIRNDVAPFSDKRVRHALSMSYDRKLAIQNIHGSESKADQQLGIPGEAWEFREPKDLPRKDLYELNVAEAKKLLQAAGVTLPLKTVCPTWNATVVGQKYVDEIVLITTQMRNHGIADITLQEETFGQFSPRFTGSYDTIHWGPNVTTALPDLGINIYSKYFSPPEGVKSPTLNLTYVNKPEINSLVTKQLQEFDRKARLQVFRQLEDVLCEEMCHTSGVTFTLAYLADPKIKGAQMPRDAYNGSSAWLRFWWMGA
jgi:peptide/nickel transport system substrate-binding protein